MPNGPIIIVIVITISVIGLSFILLISDHSLFDKIEKRFSNLHKILVSLTDWTKYFQKELLEIKNLLLEKRPMDLQILQKIMLYLSEEGLVAMSMMIFEEKFINDKNFVIIFSHSHQRLMVEIIAKYTDRDLKTDFPEIAYNRKENPEVIMVNYGAKLNEYFAAANKLLGN
ncbi:MAG: hypothetical protein NT116_02240 [Candidatus Parcubacteria bacterium]|nr:hypothetical protein [Candidatus Parcubacteria bacterium]